MAYKDMKRRNRGALALKPMKVEFVPDRGAEAVCAGGDLKMKRINIRFLLTATRFCPAVSHSPGGNHGKCDLMIDPARRIKGSQWLRNPAQPCHPDDAGQPTASAENKLTQPP